MGRSKFPGKPSKHIHRKRVNVLPPTGEISNVESSSSVTVDSVVENKQEEDVNESDSESVPPESSLSRKLPIKRRLTRKMKSVLRNANASKRSLLSKMCNKSSVKSKMNKGSRTPLSRKSVHSYAASCRNKVTKEPTKLVGKFVLPTRSVHSSRVIKPNKRFISELNEGITLKKKIGIGKRHCLKQDGDESKIESDGIESGSCNSESDKTTFTNGHKVVLRQARLKLPNQIGTQGPFSTKPNSSPPGTVTCGVCGAVRFYRFIKQARKFNIYSCESCRKFITKMIKRQACGNKNTQTMLVCNKGQGSCYVPPVVRNQQWKVTKCAYRARCTACWLKMCLRSFHMPPSLKQSLTLMLPKNMQGLDVIFNNTLPPLLWQANVAPKLLVDNVQDATNLKQRPVRFKNPKLQSVPSAPVPNSDVKRQKIDLKGPRVKHVCRSASIVLGQPIAIFGEVEKKCDIQDQPSNDIKISSEDKTTSDKNIMDIKIVSSSRSESNTSEAESNCSDRVTRIQCSLSDSYESVIKRDRLIRNVSVNSQNYLETKAPERKKNLSEPQNGISIDFWDGYDPESICQSGFCIISSEQFPMSAICFLCGSAGKEAMLYCSICCEPYHSFCLEQSQSLSASHSPKQCSWVCPRCTTCNECNQFDRQKVSCQKCLKAYHPECFNTKWNSEDKPTVCSKCLNCKSCGTDNITKFIGNLPLCITCFKSRKKGNFCPICQHCYDENECCSKMMECAKCMKWVHAKCENLKEDQYQMLGILPESIEYICSCCCKSKTPQWRTAVASELRSCFNQILRLLSKNKTARNLLKWSPLNSSASSSKTITNVRKITFSNEEADLDNNNYNKDMQDVNRIYSFEENDKYEAAYTKGSSTVSMVDIKNKLNSNEYSSVREFNKEVEHYLKSLECEQLLNIYQNIFLDVFPWYQRSLEADEPVCASPIPQEESQTCIQSEETSHVDVLPTSVDPRFCGFCKCQGDGPKHQESRLLYCGQNEWVHVNCALWSSEVYEEIDGSLQNVQNALNRGRLIRCAQCKQKGASVGCCYKGCHETFHFSCARIAKLNFMHDKTVYCAAHDLPGNSHVITLDRDFEVHRSVYVELDRKKRKYSEIHKVNFMVGSLCVKSLGKIEPSISDSCDAIVPMGFVCTRLFWSTVEPWKLVPYTITTSVQSRSSFTLTVDKNFTVDHTLDKPAVDKVMKEISAWQRDVDRKISDAESEDDEEQQNGDILSPELTDAILEELPHDLLDGISVQDIFPKFSYDDLISMDYKTDLSNSESFTDTCRKSELDEDMDLDKNKRGNKIESLVKSRAASQQRSCSLTINCKLDSSMSPVMKKRKIAAAREIYQLLQVDGNCDDGSSSECGSPTGLFTTNPWGTYISEEPVTCDKCQSTYRTQASYKRHLESCEMLCTSESDSEMNADQEAIVTYMNPSENLVDNQVLLDINETPVVISSYESYQSEIHTSVLNTQSYISSKATSDVLSGPQGDQVVIQNVPHLIEQKSMLQTIPVTSIALESTQNDQTFTVTQPTVLNDHHQMLHPNQTQFCVNQSVPLCVSQNGIQMNPSTNFAGNHMVSINPGGSIALNQMNQQPIDFHQAQSLTIQSLPYNNAILNVGSQNQFSKIITNPVLQTVNVPTNQWMKQVSKPTMIAQKTLKTKSRSRTIAAKRSQFDEGDTLIFPAQGTTGQMIVQHLPSANYVPTLMDAFQQPGQNVQYVATLAPQVNTVPTQSIVQIQPENNIISIVPSLQQGMYIQQPRMENQLVMDSNGTLGWSQQQTVQPVYYGFETIVQNTVMQSQQFLPTTMPGVLTANSSYSTTTQVFQTSKLEPVLDVASNSFVLVNPGQLVNSQPLVNSQSMVNTSSLVNSQPMAQSIANSHSTHHMVNSQPSIIHSHMVNSQPMVSSQPIVTSQPVLNHQSIVTAQPNMNSQSYINGQPLGNPQPVITSQPLITPQQFITPQPVINSQPVIAPQQVILPQPIATSLPARTMEMSGFSQPVQQNLPQIQVEIKTARPAELKPSQPQIMKYAQSITSHKQSTPITSANSITLPIAPFVSSEQGIPTNIVTPIPKPPATQGRPMSRVLPMPTNINKDKKINCDDEKLFFIEEKKKSIQAIKLEVIKPPVKMLTKNAVTKIEPKKVELIDSKIIKPALTALVAVAPPKLIQDIVEEMKREEYFKQEPIEPSPLEVIQKIETSRIDLDQKALEEKKPHDEPQSLKPIEISIPEDTKLDTSLKLVFQKQGQDGSYIISNFTAKQPIQVAPLRPIKSNSIPQQGQPNGHEKKQEQFEEKGKVEDVPKTSAAKKESDNTPSILYTMETEDGLKYSSSSVSDLWTKVLDAVQVARAAHNMPPLPTDSSRILNSVHFLGFKSNGLKYLIEQLPGATKCPKYKPAFNFPPHPSDVEDEYSQDHVHGTIRCVPYDKHNCEPYDMFGWLSSKHRQPEEISLDTLELLPRRVVNLPMAMKFRQLKLTSKYSVGVYRSLIHGRGLFCLRDIEAGEMVIEYAGEVIRSILTDKREKYYNSKDIGCYMFRVDDNFVVDATMKGNAARFINHSCDPNCYSRVVEILGHKHIIIFALRRILSGEELTYDYKFPFEEDKIPCTCGSRKCRKFLN